MTEKNYHHGDLKNALIQAGIEILAEEGVGGLSLRKAARRAGVSHAAPYAHFADKQTLIAAIASDGHKKINARLEEVLVHHADDPLRQFLGAVWAYMQFGLDAPAHYKITFSGAIQDEHIHPEFMDYSTRNTQVLKAIVERCRAAGILDANGMDAELQAYSIWGVIHGLVSLWIQGQLPGNLMKRVKPEELVTATLQQVVRVPIDKGMLQ
jgi:AcrR family transcriptional regulator